MKRSIIIPRIEALPQEASEVPEILDEMSVSFEAISTINWPDTFPYCPEVKFRMAWCPEGMVLHYKVNEQSVRACYGEDDGQVWTDSCAECFIRNAEDKLYYNIECNCIGAMLIGTRTSREDRCRLALKEIAQVKRWASLGNAPFGVKDEPTAWELALVIPSEVFARHPLNLKEGAHLCANFYKCGDNLPVPHYVSWNPIKAEKPDFHRPECFGELVLR